MTATPETASPAVASTTGAITTVWTLPQRILFRFTGVYLLLVIPRGSLGFVPLPPGVSHAVGFVATQYARLCSATTIWIGLHVLRLPEVPALMNVRRLMLGERDSTLAWVERAWLMVLAAAVTIAWTALDRKRSGHPALHAWLRRLVRFTLGCTMCTYGLWKVLQVGQFQPPSLHELLTPTGELSPAALMWAFMGSSPSYKAFTGAAELLGGLLLFPRRTTTLGALIVIAVMGNVTMMNFAYDVVVKGFAMTLLLMALFLVAPDLRRVIALLVLDRPAGSRWTAPPFRRPRWNTITAYAKTLYVGFAVFTIAMNTRGDARLRASLSATTALRGIYEVEQFARNGAAVPPLLTDSTRWRRIAIEHGGGATVWLMNDAQASFFTAADSAHARLTVVAAPVDPARPLRGVAGTFFRLSAVTKEIAELRTKAPASISELSYARPDRDHLVLAGRLGPDSVMMRLRWVDDSKLVLTRWRTHIVNDLPFGTNGVIGPYDGVPADPRDPAGRKVDVARLIDLRGARAR